MKKRKALKSAVLVALSAVFVGGIAMTAAGCGGGGGDLNTITVNMFSGPADKATNEKIATEWAASYNSEHGTSYTVDIKNETDKPTYFTTLADLFSKNTVGDVIYIAPRNVNTYAKSKKVIDLTQFIAEDAGLVENVKDIWPDALNYYGYDTSKTAYTDDAYTMGQHISYDEAQKGFYTDAGEKVGLYGLPKDYSNFSMGYNHRFFSTEMKQKYETTKVDETRTVWAARGDSSSNSKGTKSSSGDDKNVQYTANTGKNGGTQKAVITYAVTDSAKGITAGEPANIINIGIPVNITPFNFYMWPTYSDAVSAGDPIALMTSIFTGGKGYTVTIPGYPDEMFDMPTGAPKDANAPYDTSKGHITYTYAEYGALMWSLTYYLNTFHWDGNDESMGGVVASSGNYRTVYGGEQYEGGEQDGAQMYLLPWLYSNDANLINSANALCVSGDTQEAREALLESQNIDSGAQDNWRTVAGKTTEKTEKLRLNGQKEEVNVQYGLNSEKFIETYAAFLAIGSDWNANPNDSDDLKKESSGWGYFREGRSLFYGAGTWDAATRNETDRKYFEFGQMPTPVAERYALYSSIKDANYNMVTYSNIQNSATGRDVEKGQNASALSAGLKVYSKDEIIANQVCRQDKWGARMDSVAYAVTYKALEGQKLDGAVNERTKAAASLCAALTIDKKPQISLTYGGAQLPNFISQCKDLLNYNNKEYSNYANGAFKDMITPDGDSEGNDVWDQYYEIAKEMGDEAYSGNGSQTVAQFLAGKKITLKDNTQVDVKFDPDFADTKLDKTSFAEADTTATSRYSFAMKVLRMVAFTQKDFDLLIRMQYGLNSVRDSSMYTYRDNWLNPHDARNKPDNMLAYYRARPLKNSSDNNINLKDTSILKINTKGTYTDSQFLTPFVFCMVQAKEAQTNLTSAIMEEMSLE